MSIADVTEEGPFSKFEGLSRILTVIEGDGLLLNINGQTHRADLLSPFAFSGEDETTSILTDGSIRDFNMIFDATCWRASGRVDGPENLKTLGTERPKITALYCVSGEVQLGDGTELSAAEGAVFRDFDTVVMGPKETRSLRLDLWPKRQVLISGRSSQSDN
ncbi:MAG: HutD family protein [Rhodobacteraceae bacterium]|nr:HutD family protein [Paracoccaceae bacterium]